MVALIKSGMQINKFVGNYYIAASISVANQTVALFVKDSFTHTTLSERLQMHSLLYPIAERGGGGGMDQPLDELQLVAVVTLHYAAVV